MGFRKLNTANIRKTCHYLKRNGLKETWYAARERLWNEDERTREYRSESVSEEELESQRKWSLKQDLFFSIVVPAYRTDPAFFQEMADSVRKQSYPNWELIIADATEDESIAAAAKAYDDQRIVYLHLRENCGISENTNVGIRAAKGDYIGLLDHDDILEPDALFEMAQAILSGERSGLVPMLLYTDEDKCNGDKTRFFEPNFKENFNLDLILSNNYVCHFMMMQKELMKKLELRKQYDGAQDYDLVLRAASELKDHEERIVHIPKVLYHWRCHEKSTAENPESKRYAYEAGRRALQDFADQNGFRADAEDLKHLGFYRLRYRGDIFESRADLGAVGGRLVKNHRLVGGCMDENGKVLYKGLDEHQSGYLHSAALTQDREAVDIRCIRINPEYRDIFEKITGIAYAEDAEGLFDWTKLPKNTDFVSLSLNVCRALRDQGARILYDPEYTRRIRKAGKMSRSTGRAIRKPGDSGKNIGNDTGSKEPGEKKVTVIIPNYNGMKYLADCMDSLEAERDVQGTPDFGILVVDNHSTDGSERLLREKWPDAEKIFLNENTGFCHAVNLGIKKAETPYVILLNNDTKVRPGFIKYLYQAVRRGKKTFSASALMLMWDAPELVDDAGDYYCALGWAYSRGKGKSRHLFTKRAEVFSACGGAAIYRRAVFDRIGLFDERHFAYLEDLDIGYRAKIFGYHNYFEPEAMVVHYGSASTGSRYNEKKTCLAAENNVYVIFKNMPFFQRILNLPFLLAGFLVKFLFFAKKGMGLLYLKGLWRGVRKSMDGEGRKRRIRFKPGNFRNYLKIQVQLYADIVRIFLNSRM